MGDYIDFMFIQTETTPNPNTLKFIPGLPVMDSGTADFRDAATAARSPLAQALLQIPGAAAVFFGSDFVSVTKVDDKDWAVLKPFIMGKIMDHFTSGTPLLVDAPLAVAAARKSNDNDPIVIEIKELIETKVRPAVAQDGGDIVFHDFDQGVVFLELQGACAGCPSSSLTLKSGIENMLKHYIPEVTEVVAVNY